MNDENSFQHDEEVVGRQNDFMMEYAVVLLVVFLVFTSILCGITSLLLGSIMHAIWFGVFIMATNLLVMTFGTFVPILGPISLWFILNQSFFPFFSTRIGLSMGHWVFTVITVLAIIGSIAGNIRVLGKASSFIIKRNTKQALGGAWNVMTKTDDDF